LKGIADGLLQQQPGKSRQKHHGTPAAQACTMKYCTVTSNAHHQQQGCSLPAYQPNRPVPVLYTVIHTQRHPAPLEQSTPPCRTKVLCAALHTPRQLQQVCCGNRRITQEACNMAASLSVKLLPANCNRNDNQQLSPKQAKCTLWPAAACFSRFVPSLSVHLSVCLSVCLPVCGSCSYNRLPTCLPSHHTTQRGCRSHKKTQAHSPAPCRHPRHPHLPQCCACGGRCGMSVSPRPTTAFMSSHVDMSSSIMN
jgi:hypothetical protein